MPNVGDIKRGDKSQLYVYHACIDCSKERWVQYVKSNAVHLKCASCSKIGRVQSEETKLKRAISNTGKKRTVETRSKISCAVMGLKRTPEYVQWWMDNVKSRQGVGDKSPHWKGGRTPLCQMIRTSKKYDRWRTDVFNRDNFTCVKCGYKGNRLHAHHKKAFAVILDNNNITTYDEAMMCEELWDVSNGQTLCSDVCHDHEHGGKVSGWKRRMISQV